MSTGLMSCVRENTPPLDSEMQAEITTMSLPSEYSEPQKRRRFNALKNLRRIFRRRTVASAETLPSKGKIRSHIAPGELADSHFRDSLGAYKQPSLVSIRSTNDGRDYEGNRSSCRGGNISCSVEYGRGISGGGNGHKSRTKQLKDYPFDDVDRRGDRSQHKLPAVPSDRLSIQRHYEASASDWNGSAAHKRSHSEDRLKEGVPLDQEISKSHESVFREPDTDMAMLTIGLKTELIDVLRKRRSRPDTYENNLETTTLSPKRLSAEMYDLRNTLPNRRAVDPDTQVRLVGSDVPDLTALPQSHTKISEEYTPSSGLLSHSAARHKMAVRPKKKGPTRYRRSMDSEVVGNETSKYEQKSDLEYREARLTSRQMSEERPKTTSSTAFDTKSAVLQSTPLSSRVATERPKTMEPIGSGNSGYSMGNSPSKPSFTFFEGLKTSNRTSYSNLTKSEEYLQETGKDHSRFESTNGGGELREAKTTSTHIAAASPCLQHISAGRRKSVEKSQSFKIFSHPAPQTPLESVPDRKELFNMNRPVSYKEFSKSGHAFDSPKPAVRSNMLETKLTASKHTVDSILPIIKTNNIIQIEENIDKLVSSPFVPSLMKKTGATDQPNKSKNNVSITNIGPAAEIMKSPGVNFRRRSSSTMEKSPSVGSLNTLGSEESKVPEFLRVHLNRVENTRPKSSIVLYKGTSDTLPRRYSRDLDNTKPPLPPVLNVSTLKRPSINKSQETITESNHVIIVPVNTSRKASMESVTATPTEPLPVPAESKIPNNLKSDCVNADKLADEFSERKGSVSEEKAKIERRLSIADEKSVIRKKSIPTAQTNSKGSNKEDNTPELMKVFARRSMKLKDDDDEVVHKSESQSSMVTDSDKENQSSSHEELSMDPKIEEDTPAARESKTISDSSPYRPRTFLEVKNMLQSSTNGNTANKPALLKIQRFSMIVQNDSGSVLPLPIRDDVADPLKADSDKLPEFKRILERRAEWESRAKLWK